MEIGVISFFCSIDSLNESQFLHWRVKRFLVLQLLHNQESLFVVSSVELFDGLIGACK